MRVAEFNSSGDFLAGARMSGQVPVCACAASVHEKRIIESNFDVPVFLGLDRVWAEDVPRYDSACVRPTGDDDAVLRILGQTKPRTILLDDRSGRLVVNFMSSASSMGYRMNCEEYRASEFGLAQREKRTFFLMIREDVLPGRYFPWPDAPAGTRHDVVLGEIMEDLSWDRKKGAFRTEIVKPHDVVRSFPRDYCKHYSILVDTGNLRELSVLEAQRLLGYPDEFKFPVSKTQAYRALGLSTWPPVVASILKELTDWLF